MSLQREPLVPHGTTVFIVKVCRSYCRELVTGWPVFSFCFFLLWTSWQQSVEKLSGSTAWVCFDNETRGGRAEDVRLCLVAAISQSLRSDKRIQSSEKCVKCGVEQKKWQETVMTGGGGRGGGRGGCLECRWGTSGQFRCRHGGREWRLLLYTLHTLFNGPFLRQTNWTNLT